MEQQSKKSFLIELSFVLAIGIIIYVLGKFLLGYLLPFVIAAVVAYFSQKIAAVISKKLKLSFSLCAVFSAAVLFLSVTSLVIFTAYFFLRWVGNAIGDFSVFTGFLKNLTENIENSFSKLLKGISPEASDVLGSIVGDMLSQLKTKIAAAVSEFATGIAKRAPSFLFSCIVTLVAGCYIAKDYRILAKFFKGLCSERVYENILKIKDIFSHSILKILKGYIILMLITFLELMIGFFALRIGYAPVLALAIAIIDLLPVFGTGTVLVPWGLAEIISGNNRTGFGVLVLYLVITLVRNFLEPKIIGGQIGINPLFTLIAMFAGLRLFGFWGLIIFPITLIVTVKYYKKEMELEVKN